MFGKPKRDTTNDTTSTAQRIAQIHYHTSVRDFATFQLATGNHATDGRRMQEIVERGRKAGVSSEQLAKDADAMRTWRRRSQ